MRLFLTPILAAGLAGPALSQEAATEDILTAFTETCPSVMADPTAALAKLALSGSESGAGGRTDDGKLIELTLVGEGDSFFINVSRSEFDEGYRATCTITVHRGADALDRSAILLGIEAQAPDLLGSETIVKAGGDVRATNRNGDGTAHLVRWSTPDFPPSGEISLLGDGSFLTLSMTELRRFQ